MSNFAYTNNMQRYGSYSRSKKRLRFSVYFKRENVCIRHYSRGLDVHVCLTFCSTGLMGCAISLSFLDTKLVNSIPMHQLSTILVSHTFCDMVGVGFIITDQSGHHFALWTMGRSDRFSIGLTRNGLIYGPFTPGFFQLHQERNENRSHRVLLIGFNSPFSIRSKYRLKKTTNCNSTMLTIKRLAITRTKHKHRH